MTNRNDSMYYALLANKVAASMNVSLENIDQFEKVSLEVADLCTQMLQLFDKQAAVIEHMRKEIEHLKKNAIIVDDGGL